MLLLGGIWPLIVSATCGGTVTGGGMYLGMRSHKKCTSLLFVTSSSSNLLNYP
jgi:hypothetical protein